MALRRSCVLLLPLFALFLGLMMFKSFTEQVKTVRAWSGYFLEKHSDEFPRRPVTNMTLPDTLKMNQSLEPHVNRVPFHAHTNNSVFNSTTKKAMINKTLESLRIVAFGTSKTFDPEVS
jgi:hypothetical protein